MIGSGAREHAICHKLISSPKITKLFASPGNAGIAKIASVVSLENNQQIGQFCLSNNIDLVIVGPEIPLVEGLVDDLSKLGIKAFGPSAGAARLEASKAFTKQICDKYNIPTASYGIFSDATLAKEFLNSCQLPIVIKADGLAFGKGVIIADNMQVANEAIDEILSGKFGQAGNKIVIEEYLEGPEVSFFAIADGKKAKFFAASQDHKRAFDNDLGPNTGGMGSFAPSSLMSDQLTTEIMQTIINPTMRAMQDLGTPFTGILFAGLILTAQGPKLLEYNVRYGDPETQSMLVLLESDLLEIILACLEGNLANCQIKFSHNFAVTVIMAAEGYPGDYLKNTPIYLPNANEAPGCYIFHAGTREQDGILLANGGRVLAITATGEDLAKARDKAYLTISKIDWPQGFYRKDIALKYL